MVGVVSEVLTARLFLYRNLVILFFNHISHHYLPGWNEYLPSFIRCVYSQYMSMSRKLFVVRLTCDVFAYLPFHSKTPAAKDKHAWVAERRERDPEGTIMV